MPYRLLTFCLGTTWTARKHVDSTPSGAHWLGEMALVCGALAALLAAALVIAALLYLRPCGRSLMATIAVLALSTGTAAGLGGAWDRLRDPEASSGSQSSVTQTAAPRHSPQPGRSDLRHAPRNRDGPPGLRRVGCRAVPAAQDTDRSPQVFGEQRQAWMQTGDQSPSLGTILEVPQYLAAAVRPSRVQTGLDWQLGALAALCTSAGCALLPRPGDNPSGRVDVSL